jgi:hypothetical protein
MTDGNLVGIRWLRSSDYDAAEGPDSWMGFYPDDLASATPQEGGEVAVWCLLIGIWTPNRKSDVPIRPIGFESIRSCLRSLRKNRLDDRMGAMVTA